MHGCRCERERGRGCGHRGGAYGAPSPLGRGPARDERIERLSDYQRDLERRAADVADEIARLMDAP